MQLHRSYKYDEKMHIPIPCRETSCVMKHFFFQKLLTYLNGDVVIRDHDRLCNPDLSSRKTVSRGHVVIY